MNTNSQVNLMIGVIGALVVAAAGTYFAIDYLSKDEKTETAAPAPTAVAAPADTGSTDSNAAIEAATDAAVAAVGDGTSLNADEARRIGEEVARQVAAQVAQQIVDRSGGAGGGTASSGLTAEEARRIGEEEGRRVAQEIAQAALANLPSGGGSAGGMTAAEAEQIGLAAGRRAARQVAADTAREVVQSEFGGQVVASRGGSGSSAAPDSGSGAEASAGSDTGSAPVAGSGGGSSAPAASVAVAQAQPKADALKPWWPGSSGGFGLVYAGQPKGEQAIALLFSGTPTTDALNQSVKVYDAKGQAVSGSWETAANPRLAVLRGLAPGRYTVVLDGTLADSQGQALGKPLHGPVYVI